jgi:hypothetical protein
MSNQQSLWIFVGLGVVCLIAAIVGGGIKALGYTLPIVQSARRQAILAIVGIFLIAVPLGAMVYIGRNNKFVVTAVKVIIFPTNYEECTVHTRYDAVVTTRGASSETNPNIIRSRAVMKPIAAASGEPLDKPGFHQYYYEPPPLETKITHAGDTEFGDQLDVHIQPGPGHWDKYTYEVIVYVDEPNSLQSQPVNFTVNCTPENTPHNR